MRRALKCLNLYGCEAVWHKRKNSLKTQKMQFLSLRQTVCQQYRLSHINALCINNQSILLTQEPIHERAIFQTNVMASMTHLVFQAVFLLENFSNSANKFGILLPKLFLPTVRKNCSSDRKNFWNSRLKAENFQNFWDRWNNSNSKSERSEQFLGTECFLNLFLEVSQI